MAGGTVLEQTPLILAFDATRDGWTAAAFHKTVRTNTYFEFVLYMSFFPAAVLLAQLTARWCAQTCSSSGLQPPLDSSGNSARPKPFHSCARSVTTGDQPSWLGRQTRAPGSERSTRSAGRPARTTGTPSRRSSSAGPARPLQTEWRSCERRGHRRSTLFRLTAMFRSWRAAGHGEMILIALRRRPDNGAGGRSRRGHL